MVLRTNLTNAANDAVNFLNRKLLLLPERTQKMLRNLFVELHYYTKELSSFNCAVVPHSIPL
jgi:hypothetical protein